MKTIRASVAFISRVARVLFPLFFYTAVSPLYAAVNLYTGDATYSIPIVTPPGTNGMGPNLSLEYNSGSEGDGWLAKGWSLAGLGSIERFGPDYSLAPTYTGNDTYRLNFPGGGKLVYTGTEPSGHAGNYYRTEVESFLRIEYVISSNYWVVTDKRGVKYFFGRRSEPFGNDSHEFNLNNPSQIFAWHLSSVEDPHGMSWHISYSTQQYGILAPHRISYTRGPGLTCLYPGDWCRDVRFSYEPRPDVTGNYRSDEKKNNFVRLKIIEVRMAGRPVRKYTLDYAMSVPMARGYNSISMLTAVTETGADNQTKYPANVFNYNAYDSAGNNLTLVQAAYSGSPPEALGSATNSNPPSPSSCTYPVDINNDRLTDILVGQAGNYYYYPNLGTNNFGARIAIPNPPNALPSLCAVTKEYRRSSSRRLFKKVHKVSEIIHPVNDTTVMDMDGDGLADIVWSAGAGQWFWWKNLGTGQFADRAVITGTTMSINDVNLRFADMNGDGLMDLVHIPANLSDVNDRYGFVNANVYIYRNRGRATDGSLSFVLASTNFQTFNFTSNNTALSGSADALLKFFPSSVSLADMNADGLPDLVWLAIDGTNASTNRIYYYPNTGGYRFGPRIQILRSNGAPLNVVAPYLLPGTPVNASPEHIAYNTFYAPATNLTEINRLVDVNGDGLTDLLSIGATTRISAAGQGLPAPCMYYPLQSNGSFGEQVNLQGCNFGGLKRLENNALADMNGDGFVDFIQGKAGNYVSYALDMNNNHWNLHVAIDPMQGRSNFVYKLLRSGNTVRWVTSKVYRNASVFANSVPSETDYDYAGGLSYGWPRNEFRGYAQVSVTDPPDHSGQRRLTLTKFHQDDARKGLVMQSTARGGTSGMLANTLYTYHVTTPVTGVSRVDVTSVTDNTYDGGNTYKTRRTDYANYDPYGNARQVTSSGTDMQSRVTTTSFVYNTPSYIVDRPYRTEVRLGSSSGTKISESWLDYDGQTNGDPIKGDVTRETRWLSGGTNVVLQYRYDSFGNRIGTIDAKGNTCAGTGLTSQIDYDPVFRTFPIAETNALCQVSNKTYWGINTSLSTTAISGAQVVPGLLATSTDFNGVRSDFYWDEFGRPKAQVEPPDTAAAPTITWTYNLWGTSLTGGPNWTRESKREAPNSGNNIYILDKYTYTDGFGRTIQVKSEAEAPGQWVTQDTFYNSRGLVEWVNVPYLTSTSANTPPNTSQPKNTTLYDLQQRPIKVTNPDGTFRSMAYTPFTIASTDEKGFTTTRTYDASNRLIRITEPSAGGTTSFTHDYPDAIGNTSTLVFDATGTMSSQLFDTLGRMKSSYDNNRGVKFFTYDANGNLLTQSDAKSQVLTFTYDKLDRLLTKRYPNNAGVITYFYDDPTTNTFRKGRLWKVTDLTGSTTFTYDVRGRKIKVDKAISSSIYTTQYTYDSLNRVVTIHYPDQEVVWSSYNPQGLLEIVNSFSGIYAANLDYNALGQLTSKAVGNGKVTSYDYYPGSQRLRNLVTPGLQSLTYIYDAAGNLQSVVDHLRGASQTYGYDNLHRLTSAADGSAPSFTHSYSYDAIGNLKTGAGKTFVYPAVGSARPHAPTHDGTCSYLYDNNGNMSTRTCGATVRTFTWDYDNRLVQVKNGTTVLNTASYDYEGNQVRKIEGGTTTLMPFPHYHLINGAAVKYYFANGQRIAERDTTGALFYYHSDHLGSSNKVSNSAGTEVKATRFFPYGAMRSESGTKTVAHQFTGQQFDTSTGLYNFGARYYDPGTMRFISADDIVPDINNPQTLNRYAYANNNPVKNIDPSGRSAVGANVPTLFPTSLLPPVSDVASRFYLPAGALDVNPKAWDYHRYIRADYVFAPASQAIRAIINEPAPGLPQYPASLFGTYNDATPNLPRLLGQAANSVGQAASFSKLPNWDTYSPVNSYLSKDGTMILNHALPGHPLEGTVLRYVVPLTQHSSVVVAYGVGNDLLQSNPLSYIGVPQWINSQWGDQVRDSVARQSNPYLNRSFFNFPSLQLTNPTWNSFGNSSGGYDSGFGFDFDFGY